MQSDNSGNSILVSIIIPVYNVAKYLKESLKSVINQTYKNLEIIIIDDGSTDQSGSICDGFAKKDSRITVIHQENRGIGKTRNRALDIISGQAVAFLDPDDAYCPSFIQDMVSALTEHNADAVICKYAAIKTEGILSDDNRQFTMPSIEAGEYDRVEILKAIVDGRVNYSVWNKLYRRELWKNIRFLEVSIGEDMEVGYRIFDLCKNTVVINDILYKYRLRKGSIMSGLTPTKIYEGVLVHNSVMHFLDKNIPEVISEEKMSSMREARFMDKIRKYVYCYGKKGPQWSQIRKKMKKLIICTRKKTEIKNYKIKLAYKMALHCPWLLKYVFSISHGTKEFIWKLFVAK